MRRRKRKPTLETVRHRLKLAIIEARRYGVDVGDVWRQAELEYRIVYGKDETE